MDGAESLVRTLVANGVEICFANPGTSEMHFVAALDRVAEMRCVLAHLGDAYQAGRERFGLGVAFLAQPIDSRDLTRPYPEWLKTGEAMPTT